MVKRLQTRYSGFKLSATQVHFVMFRRALMHIPQKWVLNKVKTLYFLHRFI